MDGAPASRKRHPPFSGFRPSPEKPEGEVFPSPSASPTKVGVQEDMRLDDLKNGIVKWRANARPTRCVSTSCLGDQWGNIKMVPQERLELPTP